MDCIRLEVFYDMIYGAKKLIGEFYMRNWKKVKNEKPEINKEDYLVEKDAPEIRILQSREVIVKRGNQYAVAVYTETYEEPEHKLLDGKVYWELFAFHDYVNGVIVEEDDEWAEIE